MEKEFTRSEIIESLNETVLKKKPVIGAGASAGIIAKCAESGGADFIVAYSTGLSRLKGHPTTPYGDMDSNDVTLEMADELLQVVENTPVIGGAYASDPNTRDLEELIEKFLNAGYSGIINFPTVAMYGNKGSRWREMRESQGFGWTREVKMMRKAHEMDVFTIAYVWSPEDARDMAEIPVDVVCPHAGGTAGGKAGYKADPIEESARHVQDIIKSVRDVNDDILCLGHGGPFANPKDTEYLYENTDASGFVGASAIERIPVEKAVEEQVKEFKSQNLK